jgi:ABC-type enterochelin transport system substrate-binding protein
MGRKKRVTPDDPAQYARFVEIAKQNEADDAGTLFEEAFKKITKAKPTQSGEKKDRTRQD